MKHGVYIILTGGGSAAISNILSRGGASEYFIGAELPYNQKMFEGIVGEVWDTKLVSERSAHQLAAVAYQKAKEYCTSPIGIGVSASLCKASNERDGRINEAYIAVITNDWISDRHMPGTDINPIPNGVSGFTYHQSYRAKNRGFQEDKLSMLIQEVVMDHIDSGCSVPATDFYPVLQTDKIGANLPWERNTTVIMAGSFNPIHQGHIEIYNKVSDHFGGLPLIVEVAIHHHNKPSISPCEYSIRRKKIFEALGNHTSVVPGVHPHYIDKLNYYQKRFPNSKIVFVMGADVYEKIDPIHRDELNMFVFGRDGRVYTQSDHPNIIPHLKVIDNNLSSTDIRRAGRVS